MSLESLGRRYDSCRPSIQGPRPEWKAAGASQCSRRSFPAPLPLTACDRGTAPGRTAPENAAWRSADRAAPAAAAHFAPPVRRYATQSPPWPRHNRYAPAGSSPRAAGAAKPPAATAWTAAGPAHCWSYPLGTAQPAGAPPAPRAALRSVRQARLAGSAPQTAYYSGPPATRRSASPQSRHARRMRRRLHRPAPIYRPSWHDWR